MEILLEKLNLFDTLKYYQKSLGKLAATLSEDQKKLCKTTNKTVFLINIHVFLRSVSI